VYMKYADNGRLGAARRVDIKKKIKALLDRLGSARALIGKQERRTGWRQFGTEFLSRLRGKANGRVTKNGIFILTMPRASQSDSSGSTRPLSTLPVNQHQPPAQQSAKQVALSSSGFGVRPAPLEHGSYI